MPLLGDRRSAASACAGDEKFAEPHRTQYRTCTQHIQQLCYENKIEVFCCDFLYNFLYVSITLRVRALTVQD